jgi:hypothetical protein
VTPTSVRIAFRDLSKSVPTALRDHDTDWTDLIALAAPPFTLALSAPVPSRIIRDIAGRHGKPFAKLKPSHAHRPYSIVTIPFEPEDNDWLQVRPIPTEDDELGDAKTATLRLPAVS